MRLPFFLLGAGGSAAGPAERDGSEGGTGQGSAGLRCPSLLSWTRCWGPPGGLSGHAWYRESRGWPRLGCAQGAPPGGDSPAGRGGSTAVLAQHRGSDPCAHGPSRPVPGCLGGTHRCRCLCTPVPQAVTAKSTNAGLDPRDDQVLLCFYKHRLLRSENGIFLP